jgi:hypothetical protein
MTTEEKIAELEAQKALLQQYTECADFLMPVADVFYLSADKKPLSGKERKTVTPHYVIVTGRIERGRVKVAYNYVQILGYGQAPSRSYHIPVKGVEVNRRNVDSAGAGESVSLLFDYKDAKDVRRGSVIVGRNDCYCDNDSVGIWFDADLTPLVQGEGQDDKKYNPSGDKLWTFHNGERVTVTIRTFQGGATIYLYDETACPAAKIGGMLSALHEEFGKKERIGAKEEAEFGRRIEEINALKRKKPILPGQTGRATIKLDDSTLLEEGLTFGIKKGPMISSAGSGVIISANKTKVCPYCESRNVVPILYGLVRENSESHDAQKHGEVILGGCCISEDSLYNYCKDCGAKFNYGKGGY